ncbi:hypothetical protein E2C01_000825 [Portunus trituberculatus]|uniref:Uncharacterized protein n=1 Tax=Portunus trituberculatus TaxID=210409 RepID=A0A5B7CFN4_PORTR|nr:hypothetical protein [Portunus trituberculatus]
MDLNLFFHLSSAAAYAVAPGLLRAGQAARKGRGCVIAAVLTRCSPNSRPHTGYATHNGIC